jgi:hypothetical protein
MTELTAAEQAVAEALLRQRPGAHLAWQDWLPAAREILAVAAPAVRAEVAEEIARDMETAEFESRMDAAFAARIARQHTATPMDT